MHDSLIQLIEKTKYVSFDIFDTAILRAVKKPTDVFSLMSGSFASIRGNLSFNFKEVRIESERLARDRAWMQRQHSETTLDEIYQCMADNLEIDPSLCQELKQLEIDSEIQVCAQNRYIYSIFQYALSKGKRVVFTSDTYLPHNVIHRIVEKAGYKGFHNMLLSSSYGVSKAAGGLYEILLDKLSCDSQEILHLGDNYDSDVKNAKKYGLKSFFYEKCLDRARQCKKLQKSIGSNVFKKTASIEDSLYLGTIINRFYSQRVSNQIGDTDNFWYDFGYKYVGILFFGFITWLLDQIKSNRIEKLYFLSRDGYIMKKVYDLVSPWVSDAPPAQYIYASRRAWNLPAIIGLDEKTMNFLVGGTSTLTAGQFLERIGFNPNKINGKIKQAGFSGKDHKVITGRDYAMLRSLYFLLEDDIRRKAKEERQYLMEYFEKLGILNAEKIGIVDIGWHGSLQRSFSNLVALLGKSVDITGYYMGTFPKARDIHSEGHNMAAYLCEFGKPDIYHDIIKLCVEIFEFIHTAPHGSVINFQKKGGEAVPFLEKNGFEAEKTKKAQALHQGALDFLEDFIRHWKHFPYLRVTRKLAIRPIHRVLKNPSYQEAVYLGDLEHAEGFGDVYVKRYIAKPSGIMSIFFNPYRFAQEYRAAFWRTGFRKRAFAMERFTERFLNNS
jgi:predicted HAD superfamily hydrolase